MKLAASGHNQRTKVFIAYARVHPELCRFHSGNIGPRFSAAGWVDTDRLVLGSEGQSLLALYLHFFVSALKSMERVKGIEPSSQAWEARILPLNHTRAECAVT
jgi:hypothetical protein